MKKGTEKFWKVRKISHCRLLPYINNCCYIDSILEGRCFYNGQNA